MSNIRTFIAVEVSPDVRARAADLIRKLQPSGAKVSWVKPENMHLTLKFLGDIPDNETPDVCRVVTEAVRQVPPFEFGCSGAGAFPNLHRPRTIWLGVHEGLEHLVTLKRSIDAALRKELRFPKDLLDYRPHLTIGRVREGGPALDAVRQVLEEHRDFDGSLTYVEEVVVFASFLEREGPTYDAMAHAPLAEDTAAPGDLDENS